MSNHRLVGSKGCALGGSRAAPWSCFLPWFPRAGNGHEVFAEVGAKTRWAPRSPEADAYGLAASTCGVVNGSVRCTIFSVYRFSMSGSDRPSMLARMSVVSSPIDGAPRQIRRESATFLAPPRRPGSARRIAGPEPAQSFRASRNVRRHTGRACCIPLRSRSWPHSTPPRPHGSCASRKLPQTPIQFPALLRIHRRRILRTDVITVLGQVQPAIRERWTLDVWLGERLDLVEFLSAG
jgi:hypothetical protein